jgi:8-oxo-dGTP pyrophosphatase MutT (NUDIX family)
MYCMSPHGPGSAHPHKKKIRVLALCVFRQGDRILVGKGYDPIKRQHFHRPLGGAIEFGETSAAALQREIREEIRAAITDIHYLGMLENIFVFNGQPGHEIVLVFDAKFVNKDLYSQDLITGVEDDRFPVRAVWRKLDADDQKDIPLYPEGLRELVLQAPPSHL